MSPPFHPLAGIKVVDISHVIAGPFATFLLAQMGAYVLKIENINGGDVMRRGARGLKAFVALNGGKRKIRLDITRAADHARIMELVRDADVFVDNLRPGVLDRYKLGYGDLSLVNPRLVYCSISGFGRAAKGRAAYDHVVQAATGMTLASGMADDPPTKIGFPVIDAGAGMLAALAIVSGLRQRDNSGKGMLLDVSMAGAALQLMYPATCEALTDASDPQRVGTQASSGSPAADLFQTRDASWIAMAPNTPRQFMRLLEVLDLAAVAHDREMFDDPPDANAPAAFLRAKDPTGLKTLLREAIGKRDGADLEARLVAVGVPVSRVQTLVEHTRAAERDGWLHPVTLEDEGVTVRSPGLGFRVV